MLILAESGEQVKNQLRALPRRCGAGPCRSASNSLPPEPGVDYNLAVRGPDLRYLLLSDVHSNLEALEECTALAQGKYDQVLCLGDLVGYGPDPNPVIERVRAMATVIIRGNHDRACSGLIDAAEFNPLARLATQWTRDQLTPEHIEFLRSLPPGPVIVQGVQIVHGSLLDEDEYLLGPGQALPELRNLATPAIFFGHTHYQGGFMLTGTGRFQSIRCSSKQDGRTLVLTLEEGTRYLINPGSVGQPRDGDWRAAFAIFDQEKNHVEYYRTPYKLPEVQEKMRKAALPEPLIRRLEFGR
jgi:predicted phosphodiesterase